MPALPGSKILYLRRHNNRRDPVSQILHKAEFEVLEATSATEAFHLIHEQLPDLILLGEKLEDLTALEICRSLKAEAKTRAIPILLQFSNSNQGDSNQTRDLENLV